MSIVVPRVGSNNSNWQSVFPIGGGVEGIYRVYYRLVIYSLFIIYKAYKSSLDYCVMITDYCLLTVDFIWKCV